MTWTKKTVNFFTTNLWVKVCLIPQKTVMAQKRTQNGDGEEFFFFIFVCLDS